MNGLQNFLTNLTLSGSVGSILSSNEKNWIHVLLEDDPGLFDGFLRPSDDTIFRAMWHGEFPGKLLTGIAQTWLLGNDPRTKETGDRIVTLFGQVQRANGYLGPWPEETLFNRDIPEKAPKFCGKWDTWGHYHCIYGLYRWYQVTGNAEAFSIARKALDCIYDYFIVGKQSLASQRWAECNFAISHAFALFYEETGDSHYLEAAEYIVKEDWQTEYFDHYSQAFLSCDWTDAALKGIPFYASSQPRWESLYALETLAVLYRITEDPFYKKIMDSLWWGMAGYDRHNTGSFGTGEGATGNPYGAGSETCNTVAWMAFSTDYLKLTRSSYVADELELSFFNATLGSLLDGERNFTYMNDSNGIRKSAREVLKDHSYTGARDMSCCQANGNRGLSQISEWAALSGDGGLYVNYYGPSVLSTKLENGQTVTITQQTDYPRSGKIRIRISTASTEPFPVFLRIPCWSKNTSLRLISGTDGSDGADAADAAALLSDSGKNLVSDYALDSTPTPGEYYVLNRRWKDGYIIELDLDMSIHFWVMNYARTNYKVSAYWGPLLLAFQTDDHMSASTRFEMEALRHPRMTEGDGIVNFLISSAKGQEVPFTDYYTAGKSGKPFVSWLNCPSDIEAILFEKGGMPVWCNR